MPTFKYTAYDIKSRKKEGTIEAQSKDAATIILKKRGLFPQRLENISSTKKQNLTGSFLSKYTTGGISQKNRADMFFQLATLIDTGITLTEALEITAEQSDNNKIKNALKSVKDRVSEGVKLSAALSKYEDIFSTAYVRMIEIAEKTGKLSDILFKIASQEENKSSFNQRIAPVILYPAFILTLGLGIVSFLLAYVVPKMEKIFESFHRKLPFITRLLIASGIFLKHYFVLIIAAILISIVILRLLYKKNSSFKKATDKILLSIPIYRKIATSQFTSALAFQLNADIQLVEAVKNSAYVVKNSVFIDLLEEVAQKINTGVAIDTAFKETNLFDSMFIASLAMGTKTGRLPDFIERISGYYDRKLSALLKTTVALAEPVAILLLGLVVGFIVMSIMVPLFNINQLVK